MPSKTTLRTLIIAILLFITLLRLEAQTNVDSLRNVAAKASGTEKVGVLFELFKGLVRTDEEEAWKTIEQALEESESLGYVKGKVRCRLIMGGLFLRQRKFEEALEQLTVGELINKESETDFYASDMKGALGNLYGLKGEVGKALEASLAGYEIAQKTGSNNHIATFSLNIADIYQMAGKLDKATEYLSKALAIYQEEGREFNVAGTLLSMGILESTRNNHGLAIEHLERATEIYQKFNAERRLSYSLSTLGTAYMKLKRFEEALNRYDEAMVINEKLKSYSDIGFVLLNKARIREAQGKMSQAITDANKALEMTKATNDSKQEERIYRVLFRVYETLGNDRKALENFKLATQIKDTLAIQENKVKVEELTAKFEFDKKEQELVTSNESLENAKKEQALSDSRQLFLILTVVLLLVVIVLLVVSYKSYASRSGLNQKYLSEKAQNTELSKVNLEKELVLREIDLKEYVERIQQKNDLISDIESKLAEFEKEGQRSLKTENISELAQSVERKVIRSITWEEFRLKFDEVHKNFIPDLMTEHADLTNNELDICVLLKINLVNKEIAQTLNMTYDSVKKSMQRLYRKLKFDSNDELRAYIVRF